MYTKLANSILTSTVWMESDQTRIVWLTLLAMCDKNGEVQASIPGLANVARVSMEDCERAIEVFLSPDPYSRTKTDNGRRLEEIEGGWYLINHEKYRDLASNDDQKKKAAERQKRYRERLKRNGETVTSDGEGVTGCDKSRPISHTDTDADTDTDEKKQIVAKREKKPRKRFEPPTAAEAQAYCTSRENGIDGQQFVDFYTSKGWMVGVNKMVDWKSAIRTWERKNKGNNNGQGSYQQRLTANQQREQNTSDAFDWLRAAAAQDAAEQAAQGRLEFDESSASSPEAR